MSALFDLNVVASHAPGREKGLAALSRNDSTFRSQVLDANLAPTHIPAALLEGLSQAFRSLSGICKSGQPGSSLRSVPTTPLNNGTSTSVPL